MTTKKTSICVRLPPDLMAEIQTRLRDPVRKRSQYGSLTALIETLLWDWVAAQNRAKSARSAEKLQTLTNTRNTGNAPALADPPPAPNRPFRPDSDPVAAETRRPVKG